MHFLVGKKEIFSLFLLIVNSLTINMDFKQYNELQTFMQHKVG